MTNTTLDTLRKRHSTALAELRELPGGWLWTVPLEVSAQAKAVNALESQIERAGGTVEYDDEGNVSYGEVE